MKSVVLLSICLGVCYGAVVPPRAVRANCPEFCPQIFNPVCGSDGKELRSFSNKCLLNAFNCWQSRDFQPLRTGLCDEDSGLDLAEGEERGFATSQKRKIERASLPRAPRGNCPENCPPIFAPICAADGKEFRTFSNRCELDSVNCWQSKNFVSLRSGPCEGDLAVSQEKKDVQQKRCKPCTRIYLPVCGFDGEEQRVFGNHCDMVYTNCMESRNFALLKDGEC